MSGIAEFRHFCSQQLPPPPPQPHSDAPLPSSFYTGERSSVPSTHALTTRGGPILATRQATESLATGGCAAAVAGGPRKRSRSSQCVRLRGRFTARQVCARVHRRRIRVSQHHLPQVPHDCSATRSSFHAPHAKIVKRNGSVHSTCGGNAGCASFQAHGHDLAALKEEARAVWAANPLLGIDPEM